MATLRQRRTAKIFVENQGKSVSKAMRKAGFSPKYAKNPQQLTKTQTWDDLMEENLPESLITKVHHEQFSATRPVVCDKEIELYPDNDARLRAVDYGYKIRGKYAPEQIELTKRKYQDLSNVDLMALQSKLKSFLTKK